MSVDSRTKDGSFSVAGHILANEKAAARYVPIDMDGAMAWALENKVNLKRFKQPKDRIDRINMHRTELRLPPFKITRGGNSRARPIIVRKSEPLRPLVSSEDELLDRTTAYSGTLTGLVTPQIAGWLLDLNIGNRSLELRGIERFTKILKDDAWLNTGEPVIVSRDGILNDGQHRLTAIHRTGIAAELDVRFGIAREAFHATGTGKKRTAGQVLSIEGYRNTGCQAAIARLLIHYDKGQMGNMTLVESGEILRVVNSNDWICDIAAKIRRSTVRLSRTGPFGCVLVVAARTAPIERVFEFSDLTDSGKFSSPDQSEPTRRLHLRLRELGDKKGERVNPIDVAILTVKAWNAWVEGQASIPPPRIFEADRTSAGFPKVRDWIQAERLAA